MPVNPKSLKNLVQVKVLEESESTRVTRIRALRSANDWFSSLTAEERGKLVNRLYKEPQNKSGVTDEKTTEPFTVLPGTPLLLPPQEVTSSSVTPDISVLNEKEQYTLRILQVGGVAEYDYHEKKWLSGFGSGMSVDPAALERLAALGFLELVSGEGMSAVYKAKPRPSAKKSKTRK